MEARPESQMNGSHLEHSRRMVSGVIWNFLGQGWLLLIAFVTTPYIVGKLEADLYGVYSLSGVVLGYFAFLDFGLSAAATKYISQYLAERNTEKVVASFWGCFVWLIVGSIVCVSAVWLLADLLVSHLLSIPPRLQSVTTATLRIGSLTFCSSLCVGLTTGTLRSLGRFTVLNVTSLLVGTIQTILTVMLLWAEYSLPEIMVGILLCQAGLFAWQLALCLHMLPGLKRPRLDRRVIVRLFSYGGILTLGSLIGPVLANLEKLLMTRFASVRLLTFYAVPFSLVDRLGIIPAAFGAVLFPSYSYFNSVDHDANRTLHYRATLYIVVVYGYFASFFVFLGKPFLSAWMGEQFAVHSAGALEILALGGMFNAMARPAITALQGIGKPHIPVILQVTELAWYLPLVYLLVKHLGITGAAWAWSLRVLIDAVLLHVASCAELGERLGSYVRLLRTSFVPLVACSAAFWAIGAYGAPLGAPATLGSIALVSVGYAILLWLTVLDARMKDAVVSLWRRR
jgi:O-antigen/teichoic acid export membrane protein